MISLRATQKRVAQLTSRTGQRDNAAGGCDGLIARFVDVVDGRQGSPRFAQAQSAGLDLAALLGAYARAVGDADPAQSVGSPTPGRATAWQRDEGVAADASGAWVSAASTNAHGNRRLEAGWHPTPSQDAPCPISAAARRLAQAQLGNKVLRRPRSDAEFLGDQAGRDKRP